MSEMDAAVECLVNQQRVRLGLPALTVSSKLTTSSQEWSDHLAAAGQFFHGDVPGRVTAAGYDWYLVGENLAEGYLTPRDVVAAWMSDVGHCMNILNPNFRDFGAGETPSGLVPAMWSQDFGLLNNQNPLSWNLGPADRCPYNLPYSPATSTTSSSSSSTGSGSTSSGSGSTSSGSSGSGTPSSSLPWPTTPSDTPTG